MSAVTTPAKALAALNEARRAWRTFHFASAHINRLRRYRSMTDGMKADYQRYLQAKSEAQETLRRVLGGAP